MRNYTRPITVVDDKTGEIIPTQQLFGEDATKVSELCMHIMYDALYYTHRDHTGCYRSPSRPQISEFKKTPGWTKLYREAQSKWAKENPDEVQKERESEDAWIASATKRFADLFRLAKKHGVRLQWHGTSPYYTPKGEKKKGSCNTPDSWHVYKNAQIIAQIHCM